MLRVGETALSRIRSVLLVMLISHVCSCADDAQLDVAPQITVEAASELVGGDVTPVRVLDVAGAVEIHVVAPARGSGFVLHSSAVFDSSDGVVDTSVQAPIEGSYEGVDAGGLFWSRSRKSWNSTGLSDVLRFDQVSATHYTIIVRSGERDWGMHQIRILDQIQWGLVRERPEFVGVETVVYRPRDTASYPGVVLLGGSNRVLLGFEAAALAREGFVVLTLDYIGQLSASSCGNEIDLGRLRRVVEAFARSPHVDGETVSVVGVSLGAEAAVLLANGSPELFRAVASVSGMDVVTQAGNGPFCMFPAPQWANLDGIPPYYNAYPARPGAIIRYWRNDIDQSELISLSLTEELRPIWERSRIPVETLDMPVFMAAGEADELLPATDTLQRVCSLAASEGRRDFECRSYPRAGHQLLYSGGLPIDCQRNMRAADSGAFCLATIRAQREMWRNLIDFLQTVGTAQ